MNNINEKWGSQIIERQVIFDKYRTLSPLIREISLARKMAVDPDIVQMALHENDPVVLQRGIAAMERYRFNFSDHSYFAAVARSGNYYFNDAVDQYSGKQLRYVLSPKNPNDKWFYATIADGKDYQVNLDPDVHLGVTKVWINVLMKKDGETLGVIGTGIDLTNFLKETVSLAQHGVNNLFVDRNMAIQLDNDPELIDYMSIAKEVSQRVKVDKLLRNSDDIERLRLIMQQAEKTPDQIKTIWVEFNGARHLLGVAYLPEVGWFDLTLMDRHSLALIENKLILPFMFGGIFLIALVVMGQALRRWILDPISALYLSTNKIQQGNFDIDTPILGAGEIKDLSRSFASMVKYVRDSKYELEHKVNERTEKLRHLTEYEQFRSLILELLVGESPLPGILKSIVQGVEQLNPGMICSILLLSRDGKHLEKGVAPSLPDFYNAALDGIEIGMGVGSCGTAAFTGKLVIVEDITTHPYWTPYKKLAASADLGTCWSQPIISSFGQVLGTFAIYHKSAHTPTESDISLIEQTARLTSIAIERKQAEDEIQNSIAAQEDALRLARNAEVRFKTLIQSAAEAMFVFDLNGCFVEVNQQAIDSLGYTREELLQMTIADISPGFVLQKRARKWQTQEPNKPYSISATHRRKDGSIFPVEIRIAALDVDGVRLMMALVSDITERIRHEEELSRIAHFDALTGIPNRILLADRMKQAIAQTSREKNMMAVCYLDLDGFKPINDKMGHAAGDDVLVEIANRIGNTIRGGDTVARLGGDEFVVLLLGLEKGEECVTTLERLLAAIAQSITVKNKPVTVSASIGVSIYPLDDEDPDTLLRHADHAMFIAKQTGKNRFHIYDPAADRRARDQNEFLKSIRHGLEHGQFELHYQPKVNLRTKELVGAEALIRWRHPERGLLFPADFLRHIDNTDLDIAMGEWVTTAALAQMKHWRSTGLDIEVSINISGYHMESTGFVENMGQQLAQYPDMAQGRLQIEVLETVALNDIAVVRNIIESCRKIGVGFALDDFGTGYSSLSYLSGLPVDTLKIDQSFVRDMLEDKGDMAIVHGIIALARAFDRHTVAEGIETEEHYKTLLDMGCELGQGYFMARPMPPDELRNWQTNSRFSES